MRKLLNTPRYYVRWRTRVEEGNLIVTGWSLCDSRRDQMLEIAEFGRTTEDRDHAEAICRMMNIQEDLDRDNGCREG